MPFDESILDELTWLEVAGYVGLFVLLIWLTMDGPLQRLAHGSDWAAIAMLGMAFPALVYVLRASEQPALLAKCVAVVHSLVP